MKQLTDELIDKMCPKGWPHGPGRLFARMLIDKFCRINNLTGEAQPAEYITGIDGPPLQSAADDKEGGEPVAQVHRKLNVTLQDTPTEIELAQYKRMFEAACVELGRINEALGLDPDDGGAEPILAAIEELRPARPQPQAIPAGYALVLVEWLKDLKNRTNTLSALSLKSDRREHGIKMKQEIANMLAAALKVK